MLSPTPGPSRHSIPPAPGPSRSRIYYTPEFKLQLIRLCVDNGDDYVHAPSETPFWHYIQQLFTTLSGQQVSDVGKRVQTLVRSRRTDLASGDALPPTDLDRALDRWIEYVERRMEEKRRKSQRNKQKRKGKVAVNKWMDYVDRRRKEKKSSLHAVEEVIEDAAQEPSGSIKKINRDKIQENSRELNDKSPIQQSRDPSTQTIAFQSAMLEGIKSFMATLSQPTPTPQPTPVVANATTSGTTAPATVTSGFPETPGSPTISGCPTISSSQPPSPDINQQVKFLEERVDQLHSMAKQSQENQDAILRALGQLQKDRS